MSGRLLWRLRRSSFLWWALLQGTSCRRRSWRRWCRHVSWTRCRILRICTTSGRRCELATRNQPRSRSWLRCGRLPAWKLTYDSLCIHLVGDVSVSFIELEGLIDLHALVVNCNLHSQLLSISTKTNLLLIIKENCEKYVSNYQSITFPIFSSRREPNLSNRSHFFIHSILLYRFRFKNLEFLPKLIDLFICILSLFD